MDEAGPLPLTGEERISIIEKHTDCTDDELEDHMEAIDKVRRQRESSEGMQSFDGLFYAIEKCQRWASKRTSPKKSKKESKTESEKASKKHSKADNKQTKKKKSKKESRKNSKSDSKST